MKEPKNKGAGKGDKLRGGFSGDYRDNYSIIKWEDTNKMCECSKCKKDFEEIELVWVKIKDKMVLLCGFCTRIKK